MAIQLRQTDEKSTRGRKVTRYDLVTARELLDSAARAVQAGEARSIWHALTAELDAALEAQRYGQVSETRWAMLALANDEQKGQLALPGVCRWCGQ